MEKDRDGQSKTTVTKYKRKALEYIKDRHKAKELWKEASKKTNSEKGRIQTFRDQLLLLLDAYHDWISGEYRQIPYKTLTMIVVGILYFVVPTDVIPDIFIGVGLIDDAAIIAFIFKQIEKDLNQYKIWKSNETSIQETNPNSTL
ncbi:YkvA family protein [Bacillus sp. DJP31]|uniref:YkvA family protein n=1 Tax=Bacillus sp. DJP31 TaxID=3409789 RepID=UPI003BB72D3C